MTTAPILVKPREFFSPEQARELEKAIHGAENQSSGEIRIHLESTSSDPEKRARELFQSLGMAKTRDRTGVLFYLAIQSRQLAIIADSGIAARVPTGFWDNVRDLMIAEFQEERFVNGLRFGIESAGAELAKHFPRPADDRNELPDTLSYGD